VLYFFIISKSCYISISSGSNGVLFAVCYHMMSFVLKSSISSFMCVIGIGGNKKSLDGRGLKLI
jgi:hypothetical protein